jgi:hypothetical protein
MTESQPAQPQAPHQVAIEIPANLEAIYSNFALIAHSPSEMVIDFARMLPNMPQARIHARIVMTPMNAKLLLRALSENLRTYEAQYGEIVVPTGLAEQLFKPPSPEK